MSVSQHHNPAKTHTNATGRYDFYRAEVARDNENLHFCVETVDEITRNNGSNGMPPRGTIQLPE